MWPFKSKNALLRESVEEKRLQVQHKLYETTLSLYDQFIDPREPFYDQQDFWFPAGLDPTLPYNLDSQKRGEVLPVYLNEYQLKLARDQSRKLCQLNEFAINAQENRVSYVVGKGFKYQVCRKDDPVTPDLDEEGDTDPLTDQAQAVLDEWMDGHDWPSMEQEVVRRCDRDGEAFLRFFPLGGGRCTFRFIEPEHVRAPESSHPARTFGIETDPEDVQTVLGYHVVENPTATGWATSYVEADEVVHIKLNTDSSAKRGLPTFFPIRKNLERADKLLRNMSTLAQVQATFAVIRKHQGSSASAVQAFQQGLADVQYQAPVTGTTQYAQRLLPGSIIDSNASTEYEFPAGSVNASAYVEVLQAELRAIAARLVMPEYMLTADASNANFASTLVAESPSVKNFERLQTFYARKFGHGCYYPNHQLGVLWRVLVYAVAGGRLPPEVLTDLEIQATGPTLVVRDRAQDTTRYQTLNRARVLSKQTWAGFEDLDYDREKKLLDQEPVEPLPGAGNGPPGDGGLPGAGKTTPDASPPGSGEEDDLPDGWENDLAESEGVHAPKGGVTVNGKHFPGGEFIPGSDIKAASKGEMDTLSRSLAKDAIDRNDPLPAPGKNADDLKKRRDDLANSRAEKKAEAHLDALSDAWTGLPDALLELPEADQLNQLHEKALRTGKTAADKRQALMDFARGAYKLLSRLRLGELGLEKGDRKEAVEALDRMTKASYQAARHFDVPGAGKHESQEGHWITIGAKDGEDGEKHGGTHIYIGDDGTIEKGPSFMVGKKPHELAKGKGSEGSAKVKEPHEMTRAQFYSTVHSHGTTKEAAAAIDKDGFKRGEFAPPDQMSRGIDYGWSKTGLNVIQARQMKTGVIPIPDERHGFVYFARKPEAGEKPDAGLSGLKLVGRLPFKDAREDPHRAFVAMALASGKPIPSEVLKDYSDLPGAGKK